MKRNGSYRRHNDLESVHVLRCDFFTLFFLCFDVELIKLLSGKSIDFDAKKI